MGIRFTELACKEVICVRDGRRLGYISDVVTAVPEGCIQAIVVPEQGKCCGLLGGKEEYIIPWANICRVGPDIVLVDLEPDGCRCPKCKPRFHF